MTIDIIANNNSIIDSKHKNINIRNWENNKIITNMMNKSIVENRINIKVIF